MKRILASLLLLVAFGAAAISTDPLTPVFQGTTTISCTTSSAATALPATISFQRNIEIQNAGTATVFVETGSATVAAAVASGYPILAGQSKVITVDPTIARIACIAASGTQTVYATIGTGF